MWRRVGGGELKFQSPEIGILLKMWQQVRYFSGKKPVLVEYR